MEAASHNHPENNAEVKPLLEEGLFLRSVVELLLPQIPGAPADPERNLSAYNRDPDSPAGYYWDF